MIARNAALGLGLIVASAMADDMTNFEQATQTRSTAERLLRSDMDPRGKYPAVRALHKKVRDLQDPAGHQ